MRFLIVAALLLPTQSDKSAELAELRSRATTIVEQEASEEITDEEARRQVQLLLEDFAAWTEAHDARPEIRSRTHAVENVDPADPLTVNRCALFYDENREELCLIDLERSELWGGTVLFCRYFCE